MNSPAPSDPAGLPSTRRGFKGRGAHAAAVNALGRRIVRGEFQPGQILDLQRLEQEVRFGRTALREAIKVLASKGLVCALQGTGTFVTDRSNWNLLDPDLLRWHYETRPKQRFLESLAEFRLSVEPAAASYAARRRTSRQLEALEAALGEMRAKVADGAAFTEADLKFHGAVLEASGNEFFTQLGPIIEAALYTRIRSVRSTKRRREDAITSHVVVFDAIRSRDSQLAAEAVQRLLAVARQQEPLSRRSPALTC